MKALLLAALLAVNPVGIRTEIGIVQNCETIETQGNLWNYDTEIEPGSFVIVTFDDMGTAEIYDDIIVDCEVIPK